MVVIHSSIIQQRDFNTLETEILKKDILSLGADYIPVDSIHQLLAALDASKGEDILLFSNFPPTYFFGDNVALSDFQIEPVEDWQWPVEIYGYSANLFRHICLNYKITGIYYITSALKRIVSDNHFRLITNNTHSYTSVKRRRSWMRAGTPYNVLLKDYILDKVTEAKENISLTFPYHFSNN